MRLEKLFKKALAPLLALSLMVSFSAIGVNAAGSDDGILFVITKNSEKYFGTTKSSFCTEFVSANGDGSGFLRYENADINGDTKTDITDLVALDNAARQNGGVDLDFSSAVDAGDLTVMRRILIGITDIEID